MPADQQWAGRAEVRTPGGVRGAVPPTQEPEPEYEQEGGGRWWLPVVFAVVGLLVVLAGAIGIWAVLANDNTPEPTQTPAAPQTTAVQTSAAPSPSIASPTGSAVTIPTLIGLDVTAATKQLDDAGLNYRLQYRQTFDATAGTIIGVDPPAGTAVPPGYEVLLVIATTPTASPTPTEASESPSPSPSAS